MSRWYKLKVERVWWVKASDDYDGSKESLDKIKESNVTIDFLDTDLVDMVEIEYWGDKPPFPNYTEPDYELTE